MKSIFAQIVLLIVYTVGFLFIWEYKGRGYFFKPEIKIVKKYEIKWIDRIVDRDYSALNLKDCKQFLACYDTARPYLDITETKGDNITVTSKLCQREWSREFKLNTSSYGDWKFYAGIGIAGIVAGYIIHKNL